MTKPTNIRVQAYRNLHKDQWTVRDPHDGLVIGHANHVELANVTFRVQQGARATVLREKRRNVHAYVVGMLVTSAARRKARDGEWVKFTYNPFRAATFVVANPDDPRPIYAADRVRLDRDGAWCQGPRYTP